MKIYKKILLTTTFSLFMCNAGNEIFGDGLTKNEMTAGVTITRYNSSKEISTVKVDLARVTEDCQSTEIVEEQDSKYDVFVKLFPDFKNIVLKNSPDSEKLEIALKYNNEMGMFAFEETKSVPKVLKHVTIKHDFDKNVSYYINDVYADLSSLGFELVKVKSGYEDLTNPLKHNPVTKFNNDDVAKQSVVVDTVSIVTDEGDKVIKREERVVPYKEMPLDESKRTVKSTKRRGDFNQYIDKVVCDVKSYERPDGSIFDELSEYLKTEKLPRPAHPTFPSSITIRVPRDKSNGMGIEPWEDITVPAGSRIPARKHYGRRWVLLSTDYLEWSGNKITVEIPNMGKKTYEW